MPTSPTAFTVRQVCTCLHQIRDQLLQDTSRAVDAALFESADDALSLVFVKLSTQTVLFIRRDGTYICPAEWGVPPDQECAAQPRWLAYRSEPSLRPVADTLNEFRFLDGLVDCVSEIASHNAELGQQLKALHAVQQSFCGELFGEELTTREAVAIAQAHDGVVHLELVLDCDELHPEAVLLPASQSRERGEHNFVLLGNDLVLQPCTLLSGRRPA